MPSVAAMTVAVVQAMPLVVKTRLYGRVFAGEPIQQIPADRFAEGFTGELFALVRVDTSSR